MIRVGNVLLLPGLAVLLGMPSAAQTTSLVDVDSNGVQANAPSLPGSISADGRVVAFASHASNLVTGDTNAKRDVFVRDLVSGTTTRVSVASNGVEGDNDSYAERGSLSADGRFVAFRSVATNLVAGDTNGTEDVFVHDRQTGTTIRASVRWNGIQSSGPLGNEDSSISADGSCVSFTSEATDLVPGDTNARADIFVRDLVNGTTTRVSVASGGLQADGHNYGYGGALSVDGRHVTFTSFATNLVAGDTNGTFDIFVHDRLTATTVRASVGSGGAQGNMPSQFSWISGDGRHVAYMSAATNLVAGDTNAKNDVFVRDLLAATTTRASVGWNGSQSNNDAGFPSISGDGHYVAFASDATNLVPGDTNGKGDIFVRDLQAGTSLRASVASDGTQSNWSSFQADVSDDGQRVVFYSSATNLVAGDANGSVTDVFLTDFGTTSGAFCFGDGSDGPCPCQNAGANGHGCANSSNALGALLAESGATNPDTLVLTASGLPATTVTVFLQGDVGIPAVVFGDGLRCISGNLKRLYVKSAIGGSVFAPGAGDPSISARSAQLGDPLAPGAIRHYQTSYRDSQLPFCPAPEGDSWNVTNGVSAVW